MMQPDLSIIGSDCLVFTLR